MPGTARHGTARHGTARHGTARHGTARQLYFPDLSKTGLHRPGASARHAWKPAPTPPP